MLVLFLCCIMKLAKFSALKRNERYVTPRKNSEPILNCKGKVMNEVGRSPDPDCNSNHPIGSASFISNSSQEVDFIQDNSDYQWFVDYGYRDGISNNHTSILSIPESYGHDDVDYYNTLAKNMDVNLAEADIESFKTENIRTLLTNIHSIYSTHNKNGLDLHSSLRFSTDEKFEIDSSESPHTSSHDEDSTSMSICKSELLFSPVKETPMPGVTFSADSLDCNFQDIILTCQANKNNYTIAFEGSATMYTEDSEVYDKNDLTSSSLHSIGKIKIEAAMTQSDTGSFTTWNAIKRQNAKENENNCKFSNNNNSNENMQLGLSDNYLKSQSLPNLHKKKLTLMQNNKKNNLVHNPIANQRPVKLFNIQHHLTGHSSSLSDMATSVDISSSDSINNQPNFSLVKQFIKQKNLSSEGSQLSLGKTWSSKSKSSDVSKESGLSLNLVGSKIKNDQAIVHLQTDKMHRSIEISTDSNNSTDFKKTFSKAKKDSEGGQLPKMLSVDKSTETSYFSEVNHLKNVSKVSNSNVQNSYKLIGPSFLKKLQEEGDIQKPVYILYPNYVLPDLAFLNEEQDKITNLLLLPQKAPNFAPTRKRPFSWGDFESLKKRDFSHIKDWESLNFLLPMEYKNILVKIPELSNHIKFTKNEKPSSLENKHLRRRPLSCDYGFNIIKENTMSNNSSIATQPSSGYRGSSTTLNDFQNTPGSTGNINPLFVYHYDSISSAEASLMENKEKTPNVLQNKCGTLQNTDNVLPHAPLRRLRHLSTNSSSQDNDCKSHAKQSMISNPQQFRHKRFSETDDEGVDAGTSSSSFDEYEYTNLKTKTTRNIFSEMTSEELMQLEEYFKICSISSECSDKSEKSIAQLRSYVKTFLNLKMNTTLAGNFGCKKRNDCTEKTKLIPSHLQVNNTLAPNNSPNVSAILRQENYNEPSRVHLLDIYNTNHTTPQSTTEHKNHQYLSHKCYLISAVANAVERLAKHFSTATSQEELLALGESTTCSKITLTELCPALYAVLSDGLKNSLETSFGTIMNSVWQVIEASSQQGPSTNALNELVLKINSEDAISEGLVKFNAFVFGLLNVKSLDAWIRYLRTRESILRKHYSNESLMLLSYTGGVQYKNLLDRLIIALQPLTQLPFQLDLFFEVRELHNSMKRMYLYQQALSPVHKQSHSNFKCWPGTNNNQSNSDSDEISTATAIYNAFHNQKSNASSSNNLDNEKKRPQSCCEPNVLVKPSFRLGEDVTNFAKKRWSAVSISSTFCQMYDKLISEDEEYADSLENKKKHNDEGSETNCTNKTIKQKFIKFQEKWEDINGKGVGNKSPPLSPTHTIKSRIPRPITSPVKPNTDTLFNALPTQKIKEPIKKTHFSKTPTSVMKPSPLSQKMKSQSRTSRVDQIESANNVIKHPPRPSSLPYKGSSLQRVDTSKVIPARRAASSSLNRKQIPAKVKVPKTVRTLSHRMPSESGHLCYNEGELLTVILKVDEKWYLCSRGSQKGLVPSNGIISADFMQT